MWFKYYGNNFHVAGTKTDFDLRRRSLRKKTIATWRGVWMLSF